MQFFLTLRVRLRKTFKHRWERIITNLPFRMMVGRFGIKLVQLGRALQVRYANWNSEFRLKHQFFPLETLCTIHVSEEVVSHPILTFDSRGSQQKNTIPLVSALFDVKGIAKVILRPYQVSVCRGNVFSWDELLPKVERVLLEHLTT